MKSLIFSKAVLSAGEIPDCVVHSEFYFLQEHHQIDYINKFSTNFIKTGKLEIDL